MFEGISKTWSLAQIEVLTSQNTTLSHYNLLKGDF